MKKTLAGLFCDFGKKISEGYPPKHKPYLVRRQGLHFTATPCYGLHEPWWVVRMMGGLNYEADPVPMHPDDEWITLED